MVRVSLALLLVLALAACGGSGRDNHEAFGVGGAGGAGGTGGDQGIGGLPEPGTTTYVVECSRQGGTEWSLIAASMTGDSSCALLILVRPPAGESVDDAGLSIAVPDGAFLTEAVGATGTGCAEPPAEWPAAVSGTGSIALGGTAADPTDITVDVVLSFDAATTVTFDYKNELGCSD